MSALYTGFKDSEPELCANHRRGRHVTCCLFVRAAIHTSPLVGSENLPVLFSPTLRTQKVPNWPMTSLANLMADSSLRQGQPARRELALDAPSFSAEERFALLSDSCDIFP